MKIETIIQRIQSGYSKGVQSSDTRLSSRHIYNKMVTSRAKLISQEAKKNQLVNQWNFQTIPCVEMIEVEPHQCPCVPPTGLKIWRSRYPIPKPLTDLNSHLMQSITTIDGSETFDYAKWNTIRRRQANKYTSNRLVFIIKEGFIFSFSKNTPQAIMGIGLFEDPLEVKNFPSYCCSSTPDCTPAYDNEFPLDADAVDTLVQMCIQELLDWFGKGTQDVSDDSMDNTTQPQTRNNDNQ